MLIEVVEDRIEGIRLNRDRVKSRRDGEEEMIDRGRCILIECVVVGTDLRLEEVEEIVVRDREDRLALETESFLLSCDI